MRVGILGTGYLGSAIAERLISKGHTLFVYNRTRLKLKSFEGIAKICTSPADVLRNADVILLVLSDFKAIKAVLSGLARGQIKNKTIIQMGTIAPQESIDVNRLVKNAGGDYFECPVLGSRSEAKTGRLILMMAGTMQQFRRWQKLFKALGPNPQHIGRIGQAAILKLALNQLISAHAVSFSLSLGLIQKNRIDVNQFMSILKQSSLFAPMYEKKLPGWLKRDFTNANFPLKHLLKDVRLIRDQAHRQKIAIDVLAATQKLIEKGIKAGFSNRDYSSVFNVIVPK